MEYSNTTIIIPTLNEGKNIGKMISTLQWLYPRVSIIVSDDGSKDETREETKKAKARFLDRSMKPVKGLCVSVLDAVKLVKTKYIVIINADFQHPPESVKEIIEELKTNDIVVGVRKSIDKNLPWHRRLMSKTVSWLDNFKLREKEFKCHDLMSGFFGIKTTVFSEIIVNNENNYELKGHRVLFDTLKSAPNDIKFSEIEYECSVCKE